MVNEMTLIALTAFAALGVYFLGTLLAQGIADRKKPLNAVVVWAPEGQEAAWGAVLDLRRRMPDANIVVLTPRAPALRQMEPGMEGVTFATPQTLAQTVCRQLHIPPGREG